MTVAAQSRKADFPGLLTAEGDVWHYLDSGATAQKPQAVIDAMARAMGADYATVHRGVYSRSAEMTLAFESARRRIAAFIGGREDGGGAKDEPRRQPPLRSNEGPDEGDKFDADIPF